MSPAEIAKTARSAISAMSAQPMMLAVLLLNVIMLGGISFAVYSERGYEAAARNQLAELLSACVKR